MNVADNFMNIACIICHIVLCYVKCLRNESFCSSRLIVHLLVFIHVKCIKTMPLKCCFILLYLAERPFQTKQYIYDF